MKCAYSAGVLDKFIEDKIYFDYCIGVSGSSGNLITYLAGQQGRNIRFFTTHIHSKDYFGFRSFLKTGNIFGLKYIYETLSNSTGEDPLDYDAAVKNPAEYRAVVTNARTGKAEYGGKDWLKKDDYRLLMASSAIPVVCKPVEINGNLYYDGGMSDSIPFKRAFEEGCDKVVTILSKPRNYIKKAQSGAAVYSLALRKYPKIVSAVKNRHIIYNKQFQEVKELEKAGKIYVFAPSGKIKIDTCTMNEKLEIELYNEGIEDYKRQKDEMLKFMAS